VSVYYLDSSALVKRYVTETGSAWLRTLVAAAAEQIQTDLVRAQGPTVVFLSADDRLLNVARAEGLSTDNPNHHP
jgi:predicted nucleic acid-binding protein